jgi:hypothetical protein
MERFQAKPWYKPMPTSFLGRFCQSVLLSVGYYEEIPGKEFKCEGYRLEEVVSVLKCWISVV